MSFYKEGENIQGLTFGLFFFPPPIASGVTLGDNKRENVIRQSLLLNKREEERGGFRGENGLGQRPTRIAACRCLFAEENAKTRERK